MPPLLTPRAAVRQTALAALIACALCVLPATASAAPARAALGLLAPGGAYVSLSPAVVPHAINELKHLSVLGGRFLVYRLQRGLRFLAMGLGFDPLKPRAIAAIGLDPDADIVASIAGTERGAVRAIRARYQAMRRWLLGARKGKAPRSRRVTLVHHRIVAKVSSEARLEAFARKRLGLRATRGAGAPQTAKRFGFSARDLARLLPRRGAKVLGVARAGERLLLLSTHGGHAILDIVEMVGARARVDAALARRVSRTLQSPAPRLRGKLAGKAFAPGASAALLLEGKRLIDIGLELARLRGLDAVASVSPASLKGVFNALDQEIGRCSRYAKGTQRISSGAALRFKLDARSMHAAAYWNISPRVARLLRDAVVKLPLIDPTAHTSVLALVASKVALGRIGRALGKAPFDTRVAPLARAMQVCGTVGIGMLAVGGWLGAVGAMYREARAEIGPAVEQVKNAIGMLVALPHTIRYRYFSRKIPASAVVQAVIGGRSAVAVERQLARRARYHKTFTFSGEKTIVHSNIRGFSGGAIGVTPMAKGQVRVTVGWRAMDVGRFLRTAAPKRSALPASILAYGHVYVPKLLRAMGTHNPRAKALLSKLASHLGRLGGNVTLDGGLLSAELRMNLK